MKRDLVYLLIDGEEVQAFGNLKTLLESIKEPKRYSTVLRKLKARGGSVDLGPYTIKRAHVVRAPFATK